MSNVEHPRHYNLHPSGVEAIKVCELLPFNVGNAIKYAWRADHKGNSTQDLLKAIFYLRAEVERPFRMWTVSPALHKLATQVIAHERPGSPLYAVLQPIVMKNLDTEWLLSAALHLEGVVKPAKVPVPTCETCGRVRPTCRCDQPAKPTGDTSMLCRGCKQESSLLLNELCDACRDKLPEASHFTSPTTLRTVAKWLRQKADKTDNVGHRRTALRLERVAAEIEGVLNVVEQIERQPGAADEILELLLGGEGA